MDIKEQIKMIRKQKRMSQADFAKMCDTNIHTLRNAEQGISCTIETLVKISKATDYRFVIG